MKSVLKITPERGLKRKQETSYLIYSFEIHLGERARDKATYSTHPKSIQENESVSQRQQKTKLGTSIPTI